MKALLFTLPQTWWVLAARCRQCEGLPVVTPGDSSAARWSAVSPWPALVRTVPGTPPRSRQACLLDSLQCPLLPALDGVGTGRCLSRERSAHLCRNFCDPLSPSIAVCWVVRNMVTSPGKAATGTDTPTAVRQPLLSDNLPSCRGHALSSCGGPPLLLLQLGFPALARRICSHWHRSEAHGPHHGCDQRGTTLHVPDLPASWARPQQPLTRSPWIHPECGSPGPRLGLLYRTT